jgi:hypothetical protein
VRFAEGSDGRMGKKLDHISTNKLGMMARGCGTNCLREVGGAQYKAGLGKSMRPYLKTN